MNNKKTNKKEEKKREKKGKIIETKEKQRKLLENMFLSFLLDGWSDRAERWVNARF